MWAFNGAVWHNSDFVPAVLEQNMRTQNNEFLSVLNSVRRGEVSPQVSEFLNSKVSYEQDEFVGTRLFPRVYQVDQYNLERLKKIAGKMKEYASIYSGMGRNVERL